MHECRFVIRFGPQHTHAFTRGRRLVRRFAHVLVTMLCFARCQCRVLLGEFRLAGCEKRLLVTNPGSRARIGKLRFAFRILSGGA
jgi:hypothetical protein